MSTWETIRTFLEAVIGIFAIVNPIGNLPIFMSLTADVPERDRRRMLRLAGVVGLIVVTVLAVCGKFILENVFHISMDEFTFGGGLLLVVIGVRNILSSRIEQPPAAAGPPRSDQETWSRRMSVAVSPIAIPLLVGPGAIATAMVLFNRYTAAHQYYGGLYAILAILVSFGLVILVLNYCQVIFRLIGNLGTLAIGRIMQIFIVAIGAHFVFESIKAIFLPLMQVK
jgi:multiple antibiotic resistance protein